MYSSDFLNGLYQNSYCFNGVTCVLDQNQQLQKAFTIMNSLIFKNQELQREVITLKMSMINLSNENQKQKLELNDLRKDKQGETSKRKFRKNHLCQKQGCGRKYSSRIALNRHLRQKNHRTY